MTTQIERSPIEDSDSSLDADASVDTGDTAFYDLQNARIKINAGGTIFETFSGTLVNRSTYWRRSLLEFNDVNDADGGVVFLDKDPDVFRHVLNYLRDPRYPFPWTLLHELEWFGIDPPERSPDPEPVPVPKSGPPPVDPNSDLSVSGGAGLINLVAMGQQNVPHPGVPSEWYRRVTTPTRIPTKSSFDTIEHQSQTHGPSRRVINLIRNGDLIVKLNLAVRARTPTPTAEVDLSSLRYSLFDSVSLRFPKGPTDVVHGHIDPVLLECLEEMSLTPIQRSFIRENDRRGVFFFDLPFFLQQNPIPLIRTAFHPLHLVLDGVRNEVENVEVQADYIYLDIAERRDLAQREQLDFPITQWKKEHLVIEPGQHDIRMQMGPQFTTPITEFFIVVKPEGGPFQRIRSISLQADGRDMLVIGGDMLRHRMVIDEGVTTEKFIYRHRFHHDDGETLGAQRIDTFTLCVRLVEPLRVASVLYFYHKSQNEIRIGPDMTDLSIVWQ